MCKIFRNITQNIKVLLSSAQEIWGPQGQVKIKAQQIKRESQQIKCVQQKAEIGQYKT